MKRILLATTGLLALATASAVAADLPARAYTKAPAYVAAYNWTGFYAGVNVGGGFGRVSGVDMDGVVGGVQAGYNWQAPGSPFVFGLEADFQGSSQEASATVAPFTLTASLPWFGTVRGRVGYSWDRFMVYGTGGLAIQNIEASVSGLGGRVTSDDTKLGYAVGGGVEWAMWDRWTTKIEYLYLDTERTDLTLFGNTFRGRAENHVIRAGLNYRF